MKKWVILLVFLAIPTITGLSHAKEEEKAVTTLEEVVVSAGRVEEKKKEVTSNVLIINEEEIRASSAGDLGDLLAEKGIGHVQKYPGALTAIGIRGFRTETHGNDLKGHVLILLNGRRAGTGNAAKIMTQNIERVEIIKGPAAVQYGSAGMGGIVNVITKQGKDKPKVFLEGKYGSFDHEKGSIGFSGKFKEFDFSGSFTVEEMDDYKTGDGEKYFNTGYEQENVSLNLGYEFLPENRIGLIYSQFDADDVGSPGYLSQNDLDDYIEKSNNSIDFIYNGKTSNSLFSWMARYFDGKDTDKWFDPTTSNPDGWDDDIPSERKTYHQGAQAQMSLNWRELLVTFGFDWVDYEIEATWTPQKMEYENPSYFLLAKTRLFDQRFIISGGLRYDQYEVEVIEPPGKKEDDHNLSSGLGLAYLLTDYLKLRANYGEAFVMPSADQMAANFVTFGRRTLGNPDLKPEKSKTYEAGIDLSRASLNASLTYFYTDFKDTIDTTTTAAGARTWENKGKSTIQGLEGNFSYDMGELFEWDFEVKPFVSFVWLTEFEDEETGQDLEYISDIQLSYGIILSGLNGFSANLSLTYTGKQNIEDFESGIWPTPVIEKGGFTVANLTISKKILEFQKYGGISMRGEIENLFDQDYEYVNGYPMPGIGFFFGLRYDY